MESLLRQGSCWTVPAKEHAFKTSDLAQKLKLPSLQREYLSVSTFGAQKATNIGIYSCSQF